VQTDVENLIYDLDQGAYGEVIDATRVFTQTTEKPADALVLQRLVRYVLSGGADTVQDRTLGGTAYPLTSRVWPYLFDGDLDQRHRRILKSLEEGGLIGLHVASYRRIKTTNVRINWERLGREMNGALQKLIESRQTLELALVQDSGKRWYPDSCVIFPFEFIFSRQIDTMWTLLEDRERLTEVLRLFVSPKRRPFASCFQEPWSWNSHTEEQETLELGEDRWDFRQRLEGTMRSFAGVFPGVFLNLKSGLTSYRKQFDEGGLDLLMLQCNGVLFSGFTDVSLGRLTRPERPGAAIRWSSDQYTGLLGACYSMLEDIPLRGLLLNHNMRLGWLESRLRGKRRAPLTLLRELLTQERYNHLDRVQALGIFYQMFPNAMEAIDGLVRGLGLKLTPRKVLMNFYKAIYPGTLERLEALGC